MSIGTSGPIQFKPGAGLSSGYWFDDVAGAAGDTMVTPAACTGTQSSGPGCNNFVFSSPLPVPLPATATTTSTQAAHIYCTLSGLYSDCEEAFNFALQADTDGGTQALSDGGTTVAMTAVPFDISKYVGISFYAMLGPNDTSPTHEVKFPDINTDPRGGKCTNATTPPSTTDCYNYFETPITASAGTWTLNNVYYAGPSAELELEPGWGVPDTAFDPTTCYGINFQGKGPQALPDAGGTPIAVDLWIADINFLTQ
jgi:hypothetical protein